MIDAWSRRRAAVAAEAEADAQAIAAEQAATAEAALAERPDDALLAKAGQPDPDTLDSPEAVRAFMQSALPQRLKTRALRRLWRLNPVLANVDGLVDYGEDYTDAATVIENLQTVYQVGKGMFDKAEEIAARAEADDDGPQSGTAQSDPAQVDTAQSDSAQSDADLPEPAQAGAASDIDEPVAHITTGLGTLALPTETGAAHPVSVFAAADLTGPSQDTPAPLPRRMRFQFES